MEESTIVALRNRPMPSIAKYEELVDRHNRLHSTTRKRVLINVDPNDDDLSCLSCYLIDKDDVITKVFQNFWKDWMKPIFHPIHYTTYTVDYFQRAKLKRDFDNQVELLKYLLLTIRYKTLPFGG